MISKPLDNALLHELDSYTEQMWAKLFKEGFLKYGKNPYDKEGFGIWGILIFDRPAPSGLAWLYSGMKIQHQEKFREGMILTAQTLKPPPDEETKLIVPGLTRLAMHDYVKARDIVQVFSEHASQDRNWRNDTKTYHALWQLCCGFIVTGGKSVDDLIRSMAGPIEDRSPHFLLDHVHSERLALALGLNWPLPPKGSTGAVSQPHPAPP